MAQQSEITFDVVEHLDLLREVTGRVAQVSRQDLPELLFRIEAAISEIIGLENGSISLYDSSSQNVYGAQVEDGAISPVPFSTLHGEERRADPALLRQDVTATLSQRVVVSTDELLTVPLEFGNEDRGVILVAYPGSALDLSRDQEKLVSCFADLAAAALDRCRYQQSWQDWLPAFSRIFSASRAPRSQEDVDAMLEEIADSALKVSEADFVVLYEFFEVTEDVRIPPVGKGDIRHEDVLEGRGVWVAHKDSAVFRLLNRRESFYAENGLRDWLAAGLIQDSGSEHHFFEREGVVCSAGIPLQIENERFGALFVNYRKKHPFHQGFREHLQLFANQASLAVSNARFVLSSKRYYQDLKILNNITRELSSIVSRSARETGEMIDKLTQSIIPSDNFYLCLHDESEDTYTLPYMRDQHGAEEDLESDLYRGLTAWLCRRGKACLLRKKEKEKIFEAGEADLVGHPSAVWMGAPLKIGGHVIGAIAVLDYDEENAFNEDQLRLLESVASAAAIAVDNNRLIGEAELRLKELSALLELSQGFGKGQRKPADLLSSTLNYLCEFTGGDGSLLFLRDPGRATLLNIAAASASLQQYVGRQLELGKGLAGRVALERKPYFDNNYHSSDIKAEMFDPPPRRVCAVPLFWESKVIGVLSLSSDETEGSFSKREIEILERFAGPATIAVQNARDASFRNALIDAGPYAIVAVDNSGRITSFNAEALKLFDYADAPLGKNVGRLYWGGLKEARGIRARLEHEDTGKIKDVEIFGQSSSGQKIPVSISAALLSDERGEGMGSIGILQDLRLQGLPSRTQLLVEALHKLSDNEDLEEIAKLVVNSAVLLLFADAGALFLSEEDSFKLAYQSGGHPDHVVALEDGRANDCLKKIRGAGSFNILNPLDDQSKAVLGTREDAQSTVLVPVHTEKRLLAFLLVESAQSEHFISDQRLVETLASQAAVAINRVQLLRYRERTQHALMVSANAIAVGQIATTFLHEAKNALNGMSLTALNLQEDIFSEPDLKTKKDYIVRLEGLQSEVARFDSLSRRLQRFTHQGLQPEKEPVFLNELVKTTTELLGSALREKRLKPELKMDSSLDGPNGTAVSIDPEQIQQVLMNLLLNAIAASRERQPIRIETRKELDFVVVRVIDHGTGIRSEDRKKLFRPFFTTKGKEGVGLGLYLSRKLVQENHGGSIEIEESTRRKGSIFSVRLPC